MRKVHKNVPERFRPYPWKVEETEWTKERNKANETIFTVANGFIGVRGYIEEGFDGDTEYADATTMLNGVYEYFPYHHIWCRPGFPERYHAIVAQTNPFDISVRADGERISLTAGGKVCDYRRTLDLHDGTVTREYTYETQTGKRVKVCFTRFASQSNKNLVADRVTVTAQDACRITIRTELSSPEGCGAVKEEIGGASGDIFKQDGSEYKDGVATLCYRTIVAPFAVAVSACDVTTAKRTDIKTETNGVTGEYDYALDSGKGITLERFVAYAASSEGEALGDFTHKIVRSAAERGFAAELADSRKVLDAFWQKFDVQVDTDDAIQQGLRFSVFQIYQSTGKDGLTNISANGLSGTGYSGHTFWDTEIFIMPAYIYNDPEIAKKLIEYRYNILDKARERAAQMGDKGALYAWNSINGEECGHVFEAVTAQYHIDCDVFYAIYRYYEATGDEAFLVNTCAEILFEISKCMAHRGSFIPSKGNKFCINVVCGPDEYNPVVDNNMYTNVLTQKQLLFTLEVAKLLREKYPAKYASLTKKCKVDDEELALWREAAERMYIPYSKELDIYMQDDNFIYKDPIDIESIPREDLPLLTHLHPLNLWRYQVCKQADIVLLTFLYSDYFTAEERKKIFRYYEPKTIHDSSLSASIHSIVACDVGDTADAYGYLRQAARMDLDDVNGNTFFGLHAACMGATWMMMVNGYAGLRIYDGVLHFKPFICEKWNFYKFSVLFRATRLSVSVGKEETVYEVTEGEPIVIDHRGKRYEVKDKLTVKTEGER